MNDTEIVQALVLGEPDGLAEAYRRYADRLFDYCAGMLGDRDAAADAVQDTFVIAGERAAQLRDPACLRPWLYAVARSRCLRLLRDRSRYSAFDEVHDVHDASTAAPETEPRRHELRLLVRGALRGLNPREREVIELALRHELDGPDLAAALGVSTKQAHALASTARAQLERALGTLVVSRTRGRDCAALRAVLEGWDGELTPLWRKRINRHISSCEECSRSRSTMVSPAALLGAAPVLAAPPALYERTLHAASDAGAATARARLAEEVRLGEDGFPCSEVRARAAVLRSAAGRGAVAAAAAACLLVPASASLGPSESAAPPHSAVGDSQGGQSPADRPAERASHPDAQAAGPPQGQGAGGAQSPGESSGDAAAGVWAEWQALPARECVSQWTLDVTAGAGVEVASATLTVDTGATRELPMRQAGEGRWHAQAEGLAADVPVSWTVTVTEPGGGSHTGAAHTVTRPGCPHDDPAEPEPGAPEPPGEPDNGDAEPVPQ